MAEPQAHTVYAAVEPRRDELKELYAYWLAKKGERPASGRADIDPLKIARFLPHVTLVDVEHAPLRYERLILPLITDGATVDMLFGDMAFDVAYG